MQYSLELTVDAPGITVYSTTPPSAKGSSVVLTVPVTLTSASRIGEARPISYAPAPLYVEDAPHPVPGHAATVQSSLFGDHTYQGFV